MPVCLNRNGHSSELLLTHLGVRAEHDTKDGIVHIGLINNMPDAALHATERQFLKLIDLASEGIAVDVSFYALPEVPRSEAGRLHVSKFYSDIEALRENDLDGVIITGAEPRSPKLTDEPYWERLISTLDWAAANTRSAIVSCLSAHAAVFHFDGIDRYRFSEKRSGLFECTCETDHFLTTGLPARFRMPHSRWNGVPEIDLRKKGYLILTRSAEAGPDIFVKQTGSLLVCLQGHPEYESNTLLLEYHRDLGRFLKHKITTPPALPKGYFDDCAQAAFSGLHGEDLINTLLAESRQSSDVSGWFSVARIIYRNWLTYVRGTIMAKDSAFGMHAA